MYLILIRININTKLLYYIYKLCRNIIHIIQMKIIILSRVWSATIDGVQTDNCIYWAL
jgi:hypothetical protein